MTTSMCTRSEDELSDGMHLVATVTLPQTKITSTQGSGVVWV